MNSYNILNKGLKINKSFFLLFLFCLTYLQGNNEVEKEKSFIEDKKNSTIVVSDIEELQEKEIDIEELLKKMGINLDEDEDDVEEDDED